MLQRFKMCRVDSNLEGFRTLFQAGPRLVGLCVMSLALGCATPTDPAGPTQIMTSEPLPTWLGALAELGRSPELDEAAAWLCARGSHAVVDDEVRHFVHLYDGQVRGHLVYGSRIPVSYTHLTLPTILRV